jgi:release factor glutamine methyltransferase
VKLKEALARARKILDESKIEDASLEAEILLRYILKIDRAQLYTAFDSDLARHQKRDYLKLIERRCRGEPSAYITGHREFYGLDFTVNPGVLIPRPETELLVEKALEFAANHKIYSIADVGTGCGAIAVCLAKNLDGVKIYALDASDIVLKVAGENSQKHGVSGVIELVRSDLLESLPEPVDMIIANLPYVKTAEVPEKGPVSFEPVLALDGGPEGLAAIERLCRQSAGKIRSNGCMLLEMGPGQAASLRQLITEMYPAASNMIYRDYAGIERVIGVYLTSQRT